MSSTDSNDLLESACILIEAYIQLNIKQYIHENFQSNIVRDITNLLQQTMADMADMACDMHCIIEQAFEIVYAHIVPPRSSGNTHIINQPVDVAMTRSQIDYLQNVYQPDQRTPEWYEFRYQHLTASNIWKTFISESTRNQLIFEKCQPLNTQKYGAVNIESPMHWGQKYEPVSVQLYERNYGTNVSDFGCIPHKTLEFLAASPDGINTLETSNRYGRMLEIKNIVNREITGNPKMEYWIQMQIQLEVCDLNECDFLETRFKEYADYEAYAADIETTDKGMMMLFMRPDGQPVYAYAPLHIAAIETWQDEMMEKYKELTWLKNIYWKLDQLSCVLVLRNKLWFAEAAVKPLQDIWHIIETEKKTGYSHRAPKKINRAKAKPSGANQPTNIEMSAQCFITIET